jgi:hypothetical protein
MLVTRFHVCPQSHLQPLLQSHFRHRMCDPAGCQRKCGVPQNLDGFGGGRQNLCCAPRRLLCCDCYTTVCATPLPCFRRRVTAESRRHIIDLCGRRPSLRVRICAHGENDECKPVIVSFMHCHSSRPRREFDLLLKCQTVEKWLWQIPMYDGRHHGDSKQRWKRVSGTSHCNDRSYNSGLAKPRMGR